MKKIVCFYLIRRYITDALSQGVVKAVNKSLWGQQDITAWLAQAPDRWQKSLFLRFLARSQVGPTKKGLRDILVKAI
jgi:hypothetical protein